MDDISDLEITLHGRAVLFKAAGAGR